MKFSIKFIKQKIEYKLFYFYKLINKTMPEPTINLLYINSDDFDNLFYSVLGDLLRKHNCDSNRNILYNFSILRPIPNLDLDNSHLNKYNYRTTNIYDYFDTFYDDFYDYTWIISLIKYYEAYPLDYRYKYDKLNFSMIQIVNLVIDEFLKYTFQYIYN